MFFSYFYLTFIKPCFNLMDTKPSDFKRKITRGIFPLTIIFFAFMIILPTIWFNRIFAFLAMVYSILIFIKNDFIPNGLFNPKKLIQNKDGELKYYGERPIEYQQQILMFEMISNHLTTILPKFKYKFNPYTENAEFMRISYCQFSGKIYLKFFNFS